MEEAMVDGLNKMGKVGLRNFRIIRRQQGLILKGEIHFHDFGVDSWVLVAIYMYILSA
jgi:hypothetical protein